MTDRMMNNRVAKLLEIEEQIKELTKQADALKDELKSALDEVSEEEHNTGSYIIRWKLITSNKLDSKALKESLPDVYKMYTKENSYKRFTVNEAS
jgi:predicted phage-related endonuclease